MARSGLVTLAGLALVALLAAACGGGEGAEPAPTQTVTASPTPSPTAGVALPTPIVVAGVTLYPFDAWFAQGRTLCASPSFEAPYFGPEVFSIREEQLPELSLPSQEQTTPRVCRDGITAIGYIFDNALVVLADGPHEWPVSAPAERISAGTIAGRPAVFVAPAVPGQSMDAAVIVAEDFGLTIVSRMNSVEEAQRTAESIAEVVGRENITIPEGKDSYKGPLNGVRFYNDLHGNNRRDGCLWGPYGVEDPEAEGVEILPGTPLDVIPSYLPEGYFLGDKTGTTCSGGAIDLVEANLGPRAGYYDLAIWRLSGEAAWYSPYSEDWVTPETVDGHPAVSIAPPAWASYITYMSIEVVVKEDFGLSVVSGHISLEEAKRVAEGLNR